MYTQNTHSWSLVFPSQHTNHTQWDLLPAINDLTTHNSSVYTQNTHSWSLVFPSVFFFLLRWTQCLVVECWGEHYDPNMYCKIMYRLAYWVVIWQTLIGITLLLIKNHSVTCFFYLMQFYLIIVKEVFQKILQYLVFICNSNLWKASNFYQIGFMCNKNTCIFTLESRIIWIFNQNADIKKEITNFILYIRMITKKACTMIHATPLQWSKHQREKISSFMY